MKVGIFVLLVIGIAVGGAFFFWQKFSPSHPQQISSFIPGPPQQASKKSLESHEMPKLLDLEFKGGVDKDDEAGMRKGFKIMDFYLNKWFRHSITRKSAIIVESMSKDTKFLMENGMPTFYYRTLSSDWASIKEFKQIDLRSRAAAHEYVHLYQMTQGCVLPGREGEKALWFIEGSGEWFSYTAMKESGNLPGYFSFIGVEKFLQMLIQQQGTKLMPLKNYEESGYGKSVTAGHDPGVYSYMALAVGFLTKDRDMRTLDSFCVNLGKGEEIKVAFQNAFGIPLEKFYSDFEAYFTKTFSISVEKGGALPSVDKESQIPQGYASWEEFCKVQPKDVRCAAYKR